jgi:hypothetical protein
MAESSDPLLLTKSARKLFKGTEGVPGVLLVSRSKVRWMPDEGTDAKPATLLISSITRTLILCIYAYH